MIALALAGCGADQQSASVSENARRGRAASDSEFGNRATEALVKGRLASDEVARAVPQKIIYEAEISLVVEDVSKTERQIDELLRRFGGHVAEAAIDRTQGEQLSGRWRVRVPVAEFDPFLEAVSKLGVAESRRQTAQDVTEEFIDLEARIANKKRLEERIVELLKESSGAIKDVIEVERELARVRGEIEQMEGRLR
jgi:cell division septum initiation protein DivIVA